MFAHIIRFYGFNHNIAIICYIIETKVSSPNVYKSSGCFLTSHHSEPPQCCDDYYSLDVIIKLKKK